MSTEFEIYAPRPIELLPPDTGALSQVVVDGPYTLDDDDIDLSVLPHVGKRRVFYRIHMEGRFEPLELAMVEAWFTEILESTRAVLIDQQNETYQTKTKSGKIVPVESKRTEYGRLRFFFEDGEAFYDSGFEWLLNFLADELPEALPYKFGHWEPLEGRIEGRDFAQAVEWFQKDTDLFMQAKTPFALISLLGIACKKKFEGYHPKHWQRRWFYLSSLDFDLRPVLFSKPKVMERVRRVFQAISLELDVVYSDLSQHEDRTKHYTWAGLPRLTPDMMCVGKVYGEVWPELEGLGEMIGPHHRFVGTDRFGNAPPTPPERLMQPAEPELNDRGPLILADVFPFDYTYDENKYIW